MSCLVRGHGGSCADGTGWGGLQWWQNLRHPYYNMLPAGDADGLEHMLLTFNRTRGVAAARTRHYFGFEGLWWPENTHTFYGTQVARFR